MHVGGGVDLSECDRVHLPVSYAGLSRKEKWKEKKVYFREKNGRKKNSIFVSIFEEGGRKGRERRGVMT